MLSLKSKLYVQLEPTSEDIHLFKDIQKCFVPLNKNYALNQELHMTILHIGEAERIFYELKPFIKVSLSEFLTQFTNLYTKLDNLVLSFPKEFTLLTHKFEKFGKRKSVNVLSFVSTKDLDLLHTQSFKLLEQFLHTICRTDDINVLIKKSSSLQFAESLNPHVTLAWHGDCELNKIPFKSASFKVMNTAY